MKKLNQLLFAVALEFLFCAPLQAQTTILDQSLLTQSSFNTFTPVSVAGGQTWNFNSSYGAVCSGYSGGQNYQNEDWFISPAIDLAQVNNPVLTFSHTRGSASVMNVGVTQGWYAVFATANYTGDPSTTAWVELEGLNQGITTAWQYISSGNLVIPEAAKSPNSRFAFRYKSSASQSATWEIKNVKVTGEPQDSAIFKITNWNTEWLGCTQYGPEDETLQINNVAAAMLLMDADVYCLQEVINTQSSPSIETLVSILGSDEWGGTIVPSDTGFCNQRQGIIYKKSRVQFVNATQLSSGNAAQGNSYYNNWSSGRYPAVYNVNLVAGESLIPVTLVNIHAKAEDGDADSYTRRLGASQALKTILDGAAYNTKNVMLIGDYNDYLIGTSSEACQCTTSPYQNFMLDTADYTAITQNLVDADSWEANPVIENIIISNELAGNYLAGSVAQEISVSQQISNFNFTTSDHLPVSASFQFTTLGTAEVSHSRPSLVVYPNPVKDILNINVSSTTADLTIGIYDLAGRQIVYQKTGKNSINLSALPAGVYILKMADSIAKFIKE